MAGICGWLGGAGLSARERLSHLEAMASRLADTERTPTLVHDPNAAIGVLADATQDVCLYQDRDIIAGWIGRIDWSGSRHRDRAREGGDGAAIAEAYAHETSGFLNRVQGDFTLALIDRSRDELLLAIDPVGSRALLYCFTPTGVAFASRGPSLGAHPDVARDVDSQGLFDYVHFHMVPSPRSIFRGWRKLGPGEFVVLAPGGREQRTTYWTPRYVDVGHGNERELAAEFRDSMRRAVASAVGRSRGNVGAFLSGGTDSSTVAGYLHDVTGAPGRTYSIGFDVPGYDESSYANVAVEHFHLDHHQYTVTANDVLEAAPQLAKAYGEPFGNASAVASLFCARLAASDGIETLLGGDGGDEIFAGNERYARQKVFERYFKIPGIVRSRLLEPIVAALPGERFPIGKTKSYIRQACTPLPDRLDSYNFLNRIGPSEIFAPGFLETVDVAEPLALFRERYFQAPTSSVLHRLLYLDLKFTLADNDLRKVGTTCAMAGVDVRYPFLDLELIHFANRIPPDLKLRGQKLRYFFKRASEGFLPREILTKSKHGFGVPCGRWMRDHEPLRELAYDSLSSLVRRDVLSKSFVERLRALHQGEHVDYYGVTVWVLTMLELWFQHHVD